MHTNHLYILFFFGVGGDLSIYLGISTSLEAGERHSFYLFIFLSLPVYDYFFFCARPQIQIHECAHTKRAASRDYRYRYNLFLFVCFLLYLFLFTFFADSDSSYSLSQVETETLALLRRREPRVDI